MNSGATAAAGGFWVQSGVTGETREERRGRACRTTDGTQDDSDGPKGESLGSVVIRRLHSYGLEALIFARVFRPAGECSVDTSALGKGVDAWAFNSRGNA